MLSALCHWQQNSSINVLNEQYLISAKSKYNLLQHSFKHIILLLLPLLFFRVSLLAQDTITQKKPPKLHLKIYPLGKDPDFLDKDFPYTKIHSDSLGVYSTLIALTQSLHQEAYLEASVDTLARKDSLYLAYLHIGEQYEWTQLKNGNVEPVFLEQIGFRERLYEKKPFHFTELSQLQNQLLEYAANNGYPFAKVWLDSIQISDGSVSAQLFMKKNQLVLLKELKIEGDVRISNVYMENYLGLKPESLYDHSKILRIKDRVRELPFVKTKKDASLIFQEDKATVNLFLDKKRASRFDFLIGVLPRTSSGNDQNQRLLLTGTFNGEFQNQFGLGERIYAAFEQLRPQTQELEVQFNYPYVLDFPFGVDLQFSLFKRDTTNLDVAYNLGLQYLLEGGNYIKAFWNNRSSVLLTVDQTAIQQSQSLPENLDVSNSSFGLEYAFQKLDYRFNPRKGWRTVLSGAAGTKRIKRNSQIEEIELGSLYDSLQLRTFQYKIDALLEGYLPVFKRGALKAGIQGGMIISDQPIYKNEQYRIGGNRILRGFDEESIFASRYAIGTLEYRFIIGQNSYFYLFGDYAWIDTETAASDPELSTTDFPYGFGAGITFETKVGLFGFSLAIGSQQDSPPDFSSPKVHFGYVSLF